MLSYIKCMYISLYIYIHTHTHKEIKQTLKRSINHSYCFRCLKFLSPPSAEKRQSVSQVNIIKLLRISLIIS